MRNIQLLRKDRTFLKGELLQMSDYAEQRAKELQLLIRAALRTLPEVCTDFIRAIDSTTQPLTR